MNSKLKLIPPGMLSKTGIVDHADWNYKILLGYIQRRRFKLCLRLLGKNYFNNLLEIGYGSGIFMPQLKYYCSNLYGIDIHDQNEKITETLLKMHIKAKLFSSCAENIPFTDNFFDAIVLVSSLEFVENLENACKQIKRTLKEDGLLFVITPGQSKILDLGLKMLTGKSATNDYGDRREKVIPTLIKYFDIKETSLFPHKSSPLKLYYGLKLSPKKAG